MNAKQMPHPLARVAKPHTNYSFIGLRIAGVDGEGRREGITDSIHSKQFLKLKPYHPYPMECDARGSWNNSLSSMLSYKPSGRVSCLRLSSARRCVGEPCRALTHTHS